MTNDEDGKKTSNTSSWNDNYSEKAFYILMNFHESMGLGKNNQVLEIS